jgi:putative hydrolase of the HAD superfamily
MIALLPGSRDALVLLRSLNIRLAVITNGASKVQREKLRRFDIVGFFEKIFIDTEVGYSKPDARIFQHALNELNVKPADAWMVGDNLKWDVFGAQQLKIFAVWNDFKRAGLPEGTQIIPGLIVNSIHEMAVIISNIK